VNFVSKATVIGLFMSLLTGCGGGGSGGSSSNSTASGSGTTPAWTAGSFKPASDYEAMCASPRSGNFPDVQGTVTDENFWIRSYSNDTYLWYDEIEDIDPGTIDNVLEYFDLMKTFATTSSGNAKDKFHFTYDTEDWEKLSQSGVSAGYGIEFFRVSNSPPRSWLIALVQPDTPASSANLGRGADLVEVDGVDFTSGSDVDTLNAALFPESLGESHEFVFRDLNSAEERTVTLVSTEITSTPVQSVKVIDTDSGPVGYMLFNDHIATAEAMLIDAVESFAIAQITDLIIDMRYNGGGYLDIANALASMVAGDFASGQTFSELQFNDKHPDRNPITGANLSPTLFTSTAPGFSVPTGTPLPKLNLSRVFVIGGSGTCSASEAVINGLRGIGTEVVLIGDTTCGKPYGFYAMDNCGVSYFTVQFRGVNAIGFGDYTDGFSPEDVDPGAAGTVIPGCHIDDDLSHALGDTAEARLSAALGYRDSGQCGEAATKAQLKRQHPLSQLRGEVIKVGPLQNMILRY
jgi:carboxyl-terminal processing protease